jgi:hypothetical protein
VDRIIDERAAEAEQQSRQGTQVAGVLIDLGFLPIGDSPKLLKTTQEVLLAVTLILKLLQETRDTGAGPWD